MLQGATQCSPGQVYCCTLTPTPAPTAAPTAAPTPAPTPAPTAAPALIACGIQQAVPATAVAPAAGQANFGEYPWQVGNFPSFFFIYLTLHRRY